MAFLVFQLKAPLASFGASLGDFKGTALRPRKSAVLGLVAAALGIERQETARFQELFAHLQFAVAELKAPTVLHEFQTVHSPARAFGRTRLDQLASGECNTSLVPRDYLQDGHWLVALEGHEAHLLAVQSALQSPRFPLYLGRKACPLSAFTAPLLVPHADCVSAAFQAWVENVFVSVPKHPIPVAWEKGMTSGLRAALSRRTNDVRNSLVANFFTSREELEGFFDLKGAPSCT